MSVTGALHSRHAEPHAAATLPPQPDPSRPPQRNDDNISCNRFLSLTPSEDGRSSMGSDDTDMATLGASQTLNHSDRPSPPRDDRMASSNPADESDESMICLQDLGYFQRREIRRLLSLRRQCACGCRTCACRCVPSPRLSRCLSQDSLGLRSEYSFASHSSGMLYSFVGGAFSGAGFDALPTPRSAADMELFEADLFDAVNAGAQIDFPLDPIDEHSAP